MDYNKPVFQKFSTISRLPSLPGVLLKLIQTCNQDSAGLADVAGIVETDPSLSGRILRLVNSAHYGLTYRVNSMHQAVNLIGMSTIKNLALCASVHEVFRETREDAAMDLKAFWWHSLRCGLLAKRLAEICHYDKPEEAFLCGLLHDIGKLVLWIHFGETYVHILSEGNDRNEAQLNHELRLGATHAEVGAWLLHHWGLPSFMSDAILYHHEPRPRIKHAFLLVKTVYSAHEMCLEDNNHPENKELYLHVAEEILGIKQADALTALNSADRGLADVAKALQLDVKAPGKTDEKAEYSSVEHAELTGEIRDLSLLKGTLENLLTAQTQEEILRVLTEGIQILFDRNRTLFFLLDEERKTLQCVCPRQEAQAYSSESNSIPLKTEQSLIVRCAQEKKAFCSYTDKDPFPLERPIVDDQIIRHLGKGGIYCLPMLASGQAVAVMVLAMDVTEQAFFSQHANLLRLFAQQGGLALLVESIQRKRFEEIQKERLNAIYTFTRKISHEVKSPLSIIKNYLQILGMKIADQNIAQEEIRIINGEIDRVSNILDKLSSLYSNDDFQVNEQVDINEMLKDMTKIMEEAMSKNSGITLNMDLDPDLPKITASRDALKQIFINLIRNSVEAMENGGELTLRTRKHEAGTIKGEGALEREPTDIVEVAVSDNGKGISDVVRQRIFEPFVGTKQEGHSGLGLSIVHSLVESCGGKISCEDKPTGGATFRIRFPLKTN